MFLFMFSIYYLNIVLNYFLIILDDGTEGQVRYQSLIPRPCEIEFPLLVNRIDGYGLHYGTPSTSVTSTMWPSSTGGFIDIVDYPDYTNCYVNVQAQSECTQIKG